MGGARLYRKYDLVMVKKRFRDDYETSGDRSLDLLHVRHIRVTLVEELHLPVTKKKPYYHSFIS